MKKMSKRLIIGIIIAYIFILGIGYLGVTFYFSNHFLRGTTLNGVDCSNMTVDEVKTRMAKKIGDYKLRIEEIDGKIETITAEALGLTYVDDYKVDQLMEQQNQWVWITAFFKKNAYELSAGATYKPWKLEQVMDDMSCFQEQNIISPKDAYLEEKDGKYSIVSEIKGTTLDREKVKTVIDESVRKGIETINLEKEGCYNLPKVTQEDENLKKQMEMRNRVQQTELVLTFGNERETVTSSMVKDWIRQETDGSWKIEEEKVMTYISQLAFHYDTKGMERTFTTSLGNQVTVSGGDYGWLMNKEETVEELIEAIEEGKTGALEPVYISKGMARGENDLGATYIEISLSNQKMWYYKNGTKVSETPIEEGNTSYGWGTLQPGIWTIDEMRENEAIKKINDVVEIGIPVIVY